MQNRVKIVICIIESQLRNIFLKAHRKLRRLPCNKTQTSKRERERKGDTFARRVVPRKWNNWKCCSCIIPDIGLG